MSFIHFHWQFLFSFCLAVLLLHEHISKTVKIRHVIIFFKKNRTRAVLWDFKPSVTEIKRWPSARTCSVSLIYGLTSCVRSKTCDHMDTFTQLYYCKWSMWSRSSHHKHLLFLIASVLVLVWPPPFNGCSGTRHVFFFYCQLLCKPEALIP